MSDLTRNNHHHHPNDMRTLIKSQSMNRLHHIPEGAQQKGYNYISGGVNSNGVPYVKYDDQSDEMIGISGNNGIHLNHNTMYEGSANPHLTNRMLQAISKPL